MPVQDLTREQLLRLKWKNCLHVYTTEQKLISKKEEFTKSPLSYIRQWTFFGLICKKYVLY